MDELTISAKNKVDVADAWCRGKRQVCDQRVYKRSRKSKSQTGSNFNYLAHAPNATPIFYAVADFGANLMHCLLEFSFGIFIDI